jgi:hypothetical protein
MARGVEAGAAACLPCAGPNPFVGFAAASSVVCALTGCVCVCILYANNMRLAAPVAVYLDGRGDNAYAASTRPIIKLSVGIILSGAGRPQDTAGLPPRGLSSLCPNKGSFARSLGDDEWR